MRRLAVGLAVGLAALVWALVPASAVAAGTCSAHFTNGNATPTFSGGKWTMPQVTVYQCTSGSTPDSIYVALEYSTNNSTWSVPYSGMQITHDTTGDTSFTVSFGPTEPCTSRYYFRAAMVNNDTGGTHYSNSIRYEPSC